MQGSWYEESDEGAFDGLGVVVPPLPTTYSVHHAPHKTRTSRQADTHRPPLVRNPPAPRFVRRTALQRSLWLPLRREGEPQSDSRGYRGDALAGGRLRAGSMGARAAGRHSAPSPSPPGARRDPARASATPTTVTAHLQNLADHLPPTLVSSLLQQVHPPFSHTSPILAPSNPHRPPGEKRVKGDWEDIYYWGMGGGMALGAVLIYFKPDTRCVLSPFISCPTWLMGVRSVWRAGRRRRLLRGWRRRVRL